jgi:hypothetical protein
MASFPQAFPPTLYAHLYPPPYAPHALPISFVSILPPAQYTLMTICILKISLFWNMKFLKIIAEVSSEVSLNLY